MKAFALKASEKTRKRRFDLKLPESLHTRLKAVEDTLREHGGVSNLEAAIVEFIERQVTAFEKEMAKAKEPEKPSARTSETVEKQDEMQFSQHYPGE